MSPNSGKTVVHHLSQSYSPVLFLLQLLFMHKSILVNLSASVTAEVRTGMEHPYAPVA